MAFRSTTAAVTVLLSALALSACVVAPPRQQVVYRTVAAPQIQTEVIYTDIAPPPPPVEVIGLAPAGYFWVGGFWQWQGGRHMWRGGHWEAHRSGYQWIPHQWVPTSHGWQFHGGFWAGR